MEKDYLKHKFFKKIEELRKTGHKVEVLTSGQYEKVDDQRPFLRVDGKEEMYLDSKSGDWCLKFIFPPEVTIINPKKVKISRTI